MSFTELAAVTPGKSVLPTLTVKVSDVPVVLFNCTGLYLVADGPTGNKTFPVLLDAPILWIISPPELFVTM